jgi:hypothetical protein
MVRRMTSRLLMARKDPAGRSSRSALLYRVTSGSGALALMFLYSLPAKADIWGFVDADRMPHFASSKLDDRYELLLRDNPAVEPYRRADGAKPSNEPLVPTADAAAPAVLVAVPLQVGTVSPKLQVFFEQSKNYKAVSPLLREASETHGIDYSLLKALITAESGFNPHAVSPKGAVGLMQLIPPTAARYGVTAGKNASVEKKLTDPRTNIRAGARYLADLIKMFPGRLELALAAYNAGEGAVQRAGNKIPNYPETRNYVKTVMQLYTGLGPAAVAVKPGAARVRVEMRGLPSAQANMPPAVLESRGSAAAADVLQN